MNDHWIDAEPRASAIEYTGTSQALYYELYRTQGRFQMKHIASATDEDTLKTMAECLRQNPACRYWKLSIRRSKLWLKQGDSVIVQWHGPEGSPEELQSEIAQSTESKDNETSEPLDESGVKVLGYVVSSNMQAAKDLANIIQAGVKSLCTVGHS